MKTGIRMGVGVVSDKRSFSRDPQRRGRGHTYVEPIHGLRLRLSRRLFRLGKGKVSLGS